MKQSPVLLISLLLSGIAILNGQSAQLIKLVNEDGFHLEVPYPIEANIPYQEFLQVYVGEKPDAKMPPVAGKYVLKGQQLHFIPSFGFQPGMSYTAVAKTVLRPFLFKIPQKVSAEPTDVEGFFPSADTLPANLLKVYLQFSQPMSEGVAYRHIHLIDERGDTVYQPFLPLQPELWDEDRKRLTLWLDPGRVKRDLGPNREHGAPLLPGQQYQFYLSKNWVDIKGNALIQNFTHSFYVSSPDREKPTPDHWQISRPSAGTKEVLTISFGEPMDYALAQHTICIIDSNGQPLTGSTTVKNQERIWQFTPSTPWQSGSYQIRVASSFEDLAGNNLNRLFDRDLKKNKKVEERKYYCRKLEIE